MPLQEKSHYVLHHLTSASGLSCFDSDLYWLLCLDPGFISCVCSPSSFSDITQIPWYPQTLFLSLIYTDHTLRHAQLQHGAFFQPASAKAPKSSTWDVLQHLQSPYKNSPLISELVQRHIQEKPNAQSSGCAGQHAVQGGQGRRPGQARESG